ncbi:GNAT family N-acetyltransferase [Paenibacillus sp. IB182496]|uniref:GNAT family N-acetyltransferase n=1 Tax=Paenibacillus sabuli TaxID=2772509 RepID=A0A927BN51_9BACL|nr:GNAT family N-acetyltransferase [Paenibacillus sabuli]MBD2843597.1 GNAT family N-acetyltransferase [Paenibacillus sabuli]
MALVNEAEVAEIRLLLQACTGTGNGQVEREISAYLASDARTMYGAYRQHRLVGIMGVERLPGGAVRLAHLAVRADQRRQGLGTAMIDAYSRISSSPDLIAETDREAVGFYWATGFAIVSLGEKYPGVERLKWYRGRLPMP